MAFNYYLSNTEQFKGLWNIIHSMDNTASYVCKWSIVSVIRVRQKHYEKKLFAILIIALVPSILSNYPFAEFHRNLQNFCAEFFYIIFYLALWMLKKETSRDHCHDSLYHRKIDFSNVANSWMKNNNYRQASALFRISVSIYIGYNQADRNLHTLSLSPCCFSERAHT